ncbi:serine hydrolase domain-containing protein [Pseudoroseomonas globiformis]|uniref:Serine hydrolase domain-containing protein n=1 Tax=Teichococcus globiformis TaxID=2307229 RepID=A0ABV7G4G9_9PROT
MALPWQAAATRAAEMVAGWEEHEPGGVVLGFDSIGPRFLEARGLASLDHGLPFTPATPVRLASITKHIFCAVALKEGMPMHAPLGTMVPGLAPGLAAVPLRRALDMTGGLPDLADSFGLLGIPATADFSRTALLALARGLPDVNFTPGESIAYSNTGYRLAESALQAPFGSLLARHFPNHDLFYPEDSSDAVPGLAGGYWHDPGQGWRRGRYGLNFSASGGLAASAEALMRWSQHLMEEKGSLEGLWPRLTESGRLSDGRETGYGLGLSRVALPGPALWGHGGSLPGYKNHLLLAPDLRIGVVVLSNRDEASAYRIALSVLATLTGTALPCAASLPPGLYAEEEGPFWVDCSGDAILLMGAQEPLWQHESGDAIGLQSHQPFQLKATPEGLSGMLGHRTCLLRKVDPTARLDRGLLGRWAGTAFGSEVALEVREGMNGTELVLPGLPGSVAALRPLGPGKALAERVAGPSRIRFALWLSRPDELLLVSQRSRVFRFNRTG